MLAERARRYEIGFRERSGITDVGHRVRHRFGTTVLAGPFRGMKLGTEFSDQTAPVLRLFGLYEAELHGVIEEVFTAAPPKTLVNVGCADGYYAVGLALRAPNAHVEAYDIARSAREATERLARLNGVYERVSVRKRFRGPTDASTGFVLADIEGAEVDVFSERVFRELKQAVVVIEVHDEVVAGTTQTLIERSSRTHVAEVLHDTTLDEHAVPSPLEDFLEAQQLRIALSEFRTMPNPWLVLRPRRGQTHPHGARR